MIFVPGASQWGSSPGSPSPDTFGMGSGLSQSAAITPGAGAMGYYGDTSFGGGAGGTSAAATGNATGPSSTPATNLGGVTVNAYAPTLPSMPMVGGANPGGGSAGNGGGATNLPAIHVTAPVPTISGFNNLLNSPGGGAQLPGVDVTNMSPVHVTAQTPSGFIGALANFKSDHPLLYQLGSMGLNMATGGATTLPTMVVNALVDHANGQNLVDSLLPPGVGSALSGMFNAMGNHGASGGVQQANPALLNNNLLNPPGGGASNPYGDGGGTAGNGIATSGALPDYAGLGALGNFGSAPVGGYWNQQALKMASPAYGPYKGFGGTTPQPINYANPYAPSGITTAGY